MNAIYVDEEEAKAIYIEAIAVARKARKEATAAAWKTYEEATVTALKAYIKRRHALGS